MTLDELLDRTGCAEELPARPTSWEDLMTAVAAGAIDCDQIAEVTEECVEIASQGEPRFPTWEDAVTEALLESTGDLDSEAAQTLIGCGRAADESMRGSE